MARASLPPSRVCPGRRAAALLLAIGALPLSGRAAEVVHLAPFAVVGAPLVAPATVDDFGNTGTLLTADQLAPLNARDLPAALRLTPGVTVSRYNHVGSFGGAEGGGVFVRGLGSSRPGSELKVYLDGVPLANGVFNHPLLDLASIDNAASIEVLPRLAPLTEGNAFAAVRLASPRLTQPGFLARATAAAGSFGTWMTRFDLAEKTDDTNAWVTVSRRASTGARPSSAGRLENELGRFAWQWPDGLELSYLVNHTSNRAADPGPEGAAAGPGNTRGETYLTAGWLHLVSLEHHNRLGEGALRAFLTRGSADWMRRDFSGNADTSSTWRHSGLRWRQTLRPSPRTEILAGADFDSTRGTARSAPATPAPESAFGPATQHWFSGYGGLSHKFGDSQGWQCTPSAGARYYRHRTFGSAWAPQAALTLAGGPTQLRLGFSRAVNFPGLEVAALSSAIANPALGLGWQTLRPERLDQWELGLHHAFGRRFSVDATFFRNAARHRYVMVFPPPPPPRFANIEAYRTAGGELTLRLAPARTLTVLASLTALQATPADLPYAPRTAVTLGVNWRPLPGWLLSTDLQLRSSMRVLSQARVAGAANLASVGPQRLLNVRLAHRLTARVAGATRRAEWFVAGENLFDRRDSDRPAYPLPGRSTTTGFTLDW